MTAFVALLRGVNVGRNRRVPMAELRAMLERLGFSDVATLLNSGNAVFRASGSPPQDHAAAIADAIARKLRFDVPVIVKTADELAAIVAENPLPNEAVVPARLLVAFTQDRKALATLAPIASLIVPPEKFAVGACAAYLHCPDGILISKAGEALLGKTGRLATTRNWATTLKLLALVRERDGDSRARSLPAGRARPR